MIPVFTAGSKKKCSEMKIKVTDKAQSSKVEQIVVAIATNIDRGRLKGGQKLPSINEFSEKNRVARDTIEKAYKQLRGQGYIASYPSRGYFVLGQGAGRPLRVLLLFNKLSSFKKIIYDEMIASLGEKAKVELQIHHYSTKILAEILEANLGKYDYYVLMPHFYRDANREECLNIVKMIPPHQLVLIDKNMEELEYPCKAVYQDFRMDIFQALQSLQAEMKKYTSVSLVLPQNIHHPTEIIDGIKKFCAKARMKFMLQPAAKHITVQHGVVYITTEDDDLADLIKKVRQSSLRPGRDIGIISFNETVFKELLDIAVISTDFHAMGRIAAELMLNKEIVRIKNAFQVIKRGSI